jgi:hypothetical protein
LRGEEGVVIKDRSAWLSTYPKCFVGSMAVTWMVDKGKAPDRATALFYGNQLIEEDIIHHVKDDKGFEDAKEWYRYRDADEPAYDGKAYHGARKAAGVTKSGLLQHKSGGFSGWTEKWCLIKTEPAQFVQYDSQYATKPSKVIDLSQAGLDVSECEDCKKDWHCFTLSGGDKHIHEVYCAHHSKEQQAWMDALIARGATLQREDLHSTANSLFEFNAARHDGSVVNFSEYTGQVCMVVNVASF